MASAWSQLEQMLTCAICLDKFKNPRLLPCQHSFCGDACMEGLVDYARRQIKCPECRAEHRIPYQGVSSLPSNVTLIRFLELHSRITGEEPEPVPTFMEKCSVCGEKVDGVQRCCHCEKRVCPECKEAHIDLLRRDINRINGQAKRCMSKMQEFKETLQKSEERLKQNHKNVRNEVEESCRRLIDDLQAKQRRLIEEIDSFAEQEQKTIDKLRVAIVDELDILGSNARLADEKVSNKFAWTDQELSEMKEIYTRAMEFVRLFDPEIGDFTRKMRFTLIPEFETMRRRICEIGELRFGESASSLMANSLQYCSATGSVAVELCNAAAAQAAAMAANANGSSGFSLSHSNSNTNLGSSGQSSMLELPMMQNALMRSQSDHRLASQFQARLKQQQLQQQQQEVAKNGAYSSSASRYGSSAARDYETDSLRTRYAPPRSSASSKDYASDLLTRDWPRPSDNDGPDMPFGSSIQFKSAFMRRKEKERQQVGYNYGTSNTNDDDDDLTSEASYGAGSTGRNVRFYEPAGGEQQPRQQAAKLFECKEIERAPLSGVPKLEESAYLHTRLHQMGAKAIVDKKNAEEEGRRDKDLVESARHAMSMASERSKLAQRQASEDELEKQKRANRQQQAQVEGQQELGEEARANNLSRTNNGLERRGPGEQQPRTQLNSVAESPRHSPTPAADLNSSASTVVEAADLEAEAGSVAPATPPSPAASGSGRRNLYGQAVTERSKRQLSSAIQDAAAYTRRRGAATSSTDGGEQTPEATGSGGSSGRTRRTLRSSGRSMSKQSSQEQSGTEATQASATGTAQRRRKHLARADSSQQSVDSPPTTSTAYASRQASSSLADSQSKNLATGSGGHSDNLQSSRQESLEAGQQASRRPFTNRATSTADQASTTTDEDLDNNVEEDRRPISSAAAPAASYSGRRQTSAKRLATKTTSEANDSDEEAPPDGMVENYDRENENDDDDDDDGEQQEESSGLKSRSLGERNIGNRRSREMLPNSVNKLLDRSAQIRRDSQEQRSRGESPQRSQARSGARENRDYTNTSSSSVPAQSSYFSTRSTSNTGYSSSPGGSSGVSATRQRLAYQRSQSIRDSQQLDDEITNSNNSIYTTASSGSHIASGRRSSIDEDSPIGARRLSGNSTDRTLVTDSLGRPSYRRDSSTDSPSASYQSRFLARSRTSAALSNRSQDSVDATADSSTTSERPEQSGRSYLSSRDRFMQSAAVMSSSSGGGGGAASGSQTSGSPSSGMSNLYGRGGSSAVNPSCAITTLGQYRHQPSSWAHYSDNSPFIDPFDDEDDEYTAYFPSGMKTHSEYLRNKFGRRTSSNSSSSSNLLRSRSSHSAFARGSNEDDDDDDNCDDNSDEEPKAEKRHESGLRYGSRDGSLTNATPDSQSQARVNSPYSQKGRMLYKIGSRGCEPGNFTWPRGVAVGLGSSGRQIVVADSSNHRVQVFDSSGKFLNEFGSYGSERGEFDCLAGVAISRLNKNYIVSDRYNHRIQIFDMSGRFVRSFGELGKEPGRFDLPWGVACDTSGLIYVCDKENHRIQVFDADGRYLDKFGSMGTLEGQLQHPHYIAVGKGKVVVTDTNNHRVQVFNLGGRIVQSLGNEGSAEGQFKFPRGVAMDEQGFMIVGDSGNNRLQIFNPDGVFVKSIGTWGCADGEFKGIEGVAVDNSHNILVCDRENHRIQVF